MPSKLNDPAVPIVLVTGIGGFLGGLLAQGYRVRDSVRSSGACSFAPIRRPTRSALSRQIFAPMPDGMLRSGDAATGAELESAAR
jgi:hypothetical protein